MLYIQWILIIYFIYIVCIFQSQSPNSSCTYPLVSISLLSTHTHTHTPEYYSAINKDEILLFVTTWMDLESVRQNSVSQIKTNGLWFNLCGIYKTSKWKSITKQNHRYTFVKKWLPRGEEPPYCNSYFCLVNKFICTFFLRFHI